jgi:putative colanic acid biosysnthesis UDP-glucose lipid carrier transferase
MAIKNNSKATVSLISICQQSFDVAIIVCSVLFITFIDKGTVGVEQLILATTTIIVFNYVSSAIDLYRSWRGLSIIEEFKKLAYIWFISYSIVMVLFDFISPSYLLSSNYNFIWFIVTILALTLYRGILRLVLRYARARGFNRKTVVIAGAGDLGEKVYSLIDNNVSLGLELMGFYDDEVKSDKEINGNLEKLIADCKERAFDRVYIALPLRAENRIKWLLDELSETTSEVYFVPDIFTFKLLHSKVDMINGVPTISIYDSPMSGVNRIVKGVEDKLLSSLILIFISPILLALAVGVKLSSPGPVFYRQERVSWNGSKFLMLKFRSMPVDSEKNGVEWGGAKNKVQSRFGQFIRSTSLDELPQFINVLKGDMSIVGPRPERTIFVNEFKEKFPRYMQKHMVKAGITGWAQVNGWRGDTDLNKRVEYDLFYIDNWSLYLDIKIIVITILKGFINKNAY